MKPSEADMDAKPRLHAKAGHHDRARAHAPARLCLCLMLLIFVCVCVCVLCMSWLIVVHTRACARPSSDCPRSFCIISSPPTPTSCHGSSSSSSFGRCETRCGLFDSLRGWRNTV